MGRRPKSTSRRAQAAPALLAALALAVPAAATAQPAAIDEYSLGPMGTRVVERDSARALPSARDASPGVREDPGVVGEADPVESPLAVAGSIASPAAWALAAAVALGAAVILLPRRRTGLAR